MNIDKHTKYMDGMAKNREKENENSQYISFISQNISILALSHVMWVDVGGCVWIRLDQYHTNFIEQ